MSKLPDLEAWAIFAKVAELGSFSAAAADLQLSKATISKAVARLEQRLSAPLFHRTSRRLSLTDSGRSSLERAGRILAEGEAIEEEVTDRAAEPRGTVTLAVPMSFGIEHVGPVIPEFLCRYPQISIDLRLTDRRTDLVAEGIDVALRIGSLEDSSLRARRLFSIRLPLVATPDYVATHGSPEHPRDLENHQAIIFSHLASPELWQFRHATQGDYTIRAKGRMCTDNGDVALPAVLAGVGLALMPEFLVWRYLRDGKMRALMPDWAPPPSSLYIVTPAGSLRPTRVSVLIEFLAKRFLKAPWARC